MTLPEIEAIFLLVSRITVAIMIIPIIIAIWQWKYINKPLKIFWWYRIFAVLFNLAEQTFIWFAIHDFERIRFFVEKFQIADTNFLAITYQLNNFFWLGWFYALLAPSRYQPWIKRIAGVIFIAALINYLFVEGIHGFGKFNPAATAIFTFGLAFFYLWYVYRSQLALPLTKNPYFWLSLALVIPYVASFFLFLVGEVSHEENFPLFVTMTIMKDGFLIIAQILMAIGFWRARYTKYIPLPQQEAIA